MTMPELTAIRIFHHGRFIDELTRARNPMLTVDLHNLQRTPVLAPGITFKPVYRVKMRQCVVAAGSWCMHAPCDTCRWPTVRE